MIPDARPTQQQADRLQLIDNGGMPSLSKLLPKASRIKLTPGSSTHTSRSASPSAKDRREEAQEKHVEAAEQHVKDIKHARQEKARDLEEVSRVPSTLSLAP